MDERLEDVVGHREVLCTLVGLLLHIDQVVGDTRESLGQQPGYVEQQIRLCGQELLRLLGEQA